VTLRDGGLRGVQGGTDETHKTWPVTSQRRHDASDWTPQAREADRAVVTVPCLSKPVKRPQLFGLERGGILLSTLFSFILHFFAGKAPPPVEQPLVSRSSRRTG
jgi:hypothetical protein